MHTHSIICTAMSPVLESMCSADSRTKHQCRNYKRCLHAALSFGHTLSISSFTDALPYDAKYFDSMCAAKL